MFENLLDSAKRLAKRRAHPLVSVARRLRDDLTHPRLIEPTETDRVLVLAPHMDDEAIGCGGAVLLHRQKGNPLAIAYLTDGAEGDSRLADTAVNAAEASRLRVALRLERRSEAESWCQSAGIYRVDFLDVPDGRLAAHTGGLALRRLADMIRTWQPSIVYVPSPLESHPDHRAANILALAALREARSPSVERVRCYEVWTPVLANSVMDIGQVAEAKIELLGLYASQLRDIDYRVHVEALNRYRSLSLPSHKGHAEAFFDTSRAGHERLLTGLGVVDTWIDVHKTTEG